MSTDMTFQNSPPSVDVLLSDGSIACIRPLVPGDRAAVAALHAAASDESLRRRFFTVNRAIGPSYADHLCGSAATTSEVIALVAAVGDAVLGVASAEPLGAGRAEVAFLVADAAHGLGLGTLLLEHLAAAARQHGVRTFVADVLADNSAMLRVFQDCGFDLVRSTDAGTVTLRLDTAATARAVAAADQREFLAEARSLEPLLRPRAVAVVGVRRDLTGVGAAVLRSIRGGGYQGHLFVVHRDASELDGVPAFGSFADLPEPVDLVVIAVPAHAVVRTAREAAEAGARAVVVVSSGFSEMGGSGTEAQRELVRVARRHSMRVVGPNCLGLMSTDPGVRLNATFTQQIPRPGGLAVASQSGGVGVALLDLARATDLGIASFVSLGNKADVSGNDLLAAWLSDDRVSGAALYLESFGNARKFVRLARRFSELKPLLAVVGGRSDSGQRGGASHTAAAASPAVGIDALFTQAGVISCDSLESVASAALLLERQPLPVGRRVGIVGNAGGLGILAADAASAAGLAVPEFSATLRSRLSAAAAGTAGVSNPVDLGAAPDPEGMLAAALAVLASDEVDALMLILVGTSASDVGAFLGKFAGARTLVPSKPVILVTHGQVSVPPEAARALVRLPSVDVAAAALGRVSAYSAWRSAPDQEERDAATEAPVGVRDLVTGLVAAVPDQPSRWLTEPECTQLLSAYDVDVPPSSVVLGADQAVAAATAIGYPVVLKAADPAVVHKTDRNLVRLHLTGPQAVRAAAVEVAEELRPPAPLLVQKQVPAGVEVAVGVVWDATLGPLVMVAAGGVTADLLADRAFLVPPLTRVDVVRALQSLRTWPLLTGFRGSPRLDVDRLVELVVRMGDLALDAPEIVEVDLNPVVVSPNGVVCVDAKMRLSDPVGPRDAGVPRRLSTLA